MTDVDQRPPASSSKKRKPLKDKSGPRKESELETTTDSNEHVFAQTVNADYKRRHKLTPQSQHKAAQDRQAAREAAIDILQTLGNSMLQQHQELCGILDQTFPSPLESLLAFFDRHNRMHDRSPFDRESRLLKYLSQHPDLVTMLHEIATHGHAFSPSHYPNLLVKVESQHRECKANAQSQEPDVMDVDSNENDTPCKPNTFTVYLRVEQTTARLAKKHSLTLVDEYPAYLASETVTLESLASLEDDKPALRMYAGITGRDSLTGWDRMEEDVGEDGDEPSPTRFAAYTSVNKLKDSFDIYHITLDNSDGFWDVPAAPTTQIAIRAHREIQLLESLVIAVLGALKLNMALGGVYEPTLPEEAFCSMRDKVLNADLFTSDSIVECLERARVLVTRRQPRHCIDDRVPLLPKVTIPAIPSRHVTDQAVDRKPQHESADLLDKEEHQVLQGDMRVAITKRTRAIAAYWRERGDGGPEMNPACVEKAATLCSSVSLSQDGYVDSVRLLKDVPLEEFNHPEVDFWGQLAGRSGYATRRLLAHVRALDHSYLENTSVIATDSSVIAEAFGAHVNLWDVILVHKDVWTVFVLLIVGLLQWWTAPCVVMTASKASIQDIELV